MRRYKPGLERILILAFLFAAVTFALVSLTAPEPYRPPDPDSEAGTALEAELEEACGTGSEDPLIGLCRERVTAERRWRHYRERIDPLRFGLLWLAVFGGAALFFGRWTWRWLKAGFEAGRDED